MRRKKFNQKKILASIAILLSIFAVRHCEERGRRPSDEAISGIRVILRSEARAERSEASPKGTKNLKERFFVPLRGAQNDKAFVKKVIDGDTIEIQSGERVRYIGINTPEISHYKKRAEYYGKEAKEFNRKLVFGRKVRLEFDAERFDKYGRTLAYVYLEDGTFVNAELVKQGHARVMIIKPNTKYADLFKKLQQEAKSEKRGMWQRM